MDPKLDRPLGAIWPRIHAEIGAARRRRTVARLALRAGLPLAGIAIVLAAFTPSRAQRVTPASGSGATWQLGEVSAAADIGPEYPLVREQRLFTIHGTGERRFVACVRKQSGIVAWESRLTFADCRLAADNRAVYVLGRDGAAWFCAALDERDGRTLWRQPVTMPPSPAPSALVATESGLAWTQGHTVTVCSAASGALTWRADVGADGLLSAPCPSGSALLVASSRTVHALGAAGGALLWSEPLREDAAGLSRPLVQAQDGRLYVATRTRRGGGALICLDARSHQRLWARETDAPSHLQANRDGVFVRSQGLAAFDAATGRSLWSVPAGGCGKVAFQDDTLYLVDDRGHRQVLALDRRDGRTLWKRTVAASCHGVVVSGKMGYLTGNDGRLYAILLQGAIEQAALPGPSPLSPDGASERACLAAAGPRPRVHAAGTIALDGGTASAAPSRGTGGPPRHEPSAA